MAHFNRFKNTLENLKKFNDCACKAIVDRIELLKNKMSLKNISVARGDIGCLNSISEEEV